MSHQFGLSKEQLFEIKKIIVENFKGHSLAVFVFGSRATGKYRQYSDLDLWIDSTPELSSEEINNLRVKFEESNLPIKIDIVTKTTCLQEYLPRINTEKKSWF